MHVFQPSVMCFVAAWQCSGRRLDFDQLGVDEPKGIAQRAAEPLPTPLFPLTQCEKSEAA